MIEVCYSSILLKFDALNALQVHGRGDDIAYATRAIREAPP
jgi:hypothetical protein